jgi:transposase-like protein
MARNSRSATALDVSGEKILRHLNRYRGLARDGSHTFHLQFVS